MHCLWFCQTWGTLQLAAVRTGKRSRTYGGTGTHKRRKIGDHWAGDWVTETMTLQARPAGAGKAADTNQQHFTTLSHPGCSGKCWQLFMYFSPVSLAAPSSPCWHCLWTISMPEAALQGLTTACRKWYNCKDFVVVVVVKIQETSRPKKSHREPES